MAGYPPFLMADTLKPGDEGELLEAVQWAASGKRPIELVGTATRRGLGRPLQCAATLDTSALAGITDYEPAELVLSAGAATPLADVEAALDATGQMLAFEPMNTAPLLGASDSGTLAGALACNLSGPRRIKAGAARDHFLGFAAVSGRGEAFKAGGQVVKNVTGYDLCKLIAGSWGTLAVLHHVSVKVLPRPEKTRTVLVFGLDAAGAVQAMGAALASANEPSAAAWLPQPIAARSSAAYVSGAGASAAAVRVEGVGVSVEARCAALRERLAAFGETEELHSTNSLAFWRDVRDVMPFAGDTRAVWRVSVPAALGAAVADAIAAALPAEIYMDWGGGLLWVAVGEVAGHDDAGAAVLHRAAAGAGGHATCVRAPADVRGEIDMFAPLSPVHEGLTRRLKEGFDPAGILNPGRMYAGV